MLERFTIVVPTLAEPRLAWEQGQYSPTWVEVAITLGFGSTFILLYVLFTRFFPIISIWEIQEGRHQSVPETVERIRSYMPLEPKALLGHEHVPREAAAAEP